SNSSPSLSAASGRVASGAPSLYNERMLDREWKWRAARPDDDAAIVSRCLQLYAEDPSSSVVAAAGIEATLTVLRRGPVRGRAVVLDIDGAPAGYALLASFWSNELGGEVYVIDELFVDPPYRGQGRATALLDSLVTTSELRPGRLVALELEVTPRNP